MAKYKLGGVFVELDDANVSIPDIDTNRTVVAVQLQEKTRNAELKKYKSEKEVFEDNQPSIEMEFEDAEGSTHKETIYFEHRGHFGKGMIDQSDFLRSLQNKQQDLGKIMKALRSNKQLARALQDEPSRKAFIQGLKVMIQELDQ